MTDQNPSNPFNDRQAEATLRLRLSEAPGLSRVHGSVMSGIAILSGTVREEVDIKRAMLIAQNVEGVTDVRTALMIDPNRPENQPDDWSDEPVENRFSLVEDIPAGLPVTGDSAGLLTPDQTAAVLRGSSADEVFASQLREGMQVTDSEGVSVGVVKTIRAGDFLLHRLLARDYYVPYFECKLEGGLVRLKIRSKEIKQQGWAFPH